eukprot:Clim_evm50s11 gene=Clim_evmTU50s11
MKLWYFDDGSLWHDVITKETGTWAKAIEQSKRNGPRTTVYESNGTQYTGEWKDDMRHGHGKCVYRNGDVDVGEWEHGLRHGFGTYSKKDGSHSRKYIGERCGWGGMTYKDGSVYEGEWEDDTSQGTGLVRTPNGNIFEGHWNQSKKNGAGRYYYVSKGQCYYGTWVNDVAKCGTLVDLDGRSEGTEI